MPQSAAAAISINDDGARIIMKRLIITILVFLLFGAIINVGIAWSAVNLHLSMTRNDRTPTAEEIHFIRETAPQPAAQRLAPHRVIELSGLGWRHRSYYQEDSNIHPDSPFGGSVLSSKRVTVMSCGVPLKAFRGSVWTLDANAEMDGMLHLESRGLAFPIHPLWDGLVINTLLYAAVLWSAVVVSGKIRRLLRQRRGLCPKCGYPMGESPCCTECGDPLPRRSTSTTTEPASS